MSRKWRGGAAVVAVGLTLLVGCSDAGGEEAAPPAPPPSPSATATAAASPPASPPSSPGPSSPAPATVPATPVDILRGGTWDAPGFAAEFDPLDPPEPEPAEADWPPALWQHALQRYDLYAIDEAA